MMREELLPRLLVAAALVFAVHPEVAAQGLPGGQPSQPIAGRVQLPTVVVTAQKEPADPATLPVSVTTVPSETLADAGIFTIGDAAIYAPNAYFAEFSARKLSNARFRGIGSSPANPGITTYFDGVPQLNANTSSLDLLGAQQVEFVRGPQSALFGRNTVGGLVNVTSVRPSLREWSGSLYAPLGNLGARDVRVGASGPIVTDRLAAGVAFGYGRREGFTTNTTTGNDLDFREGVSGKAQILWTPTSQWDARVIVSGERARDGDYALQDLATLRTTPFRASRDFEGHTNRDVAATTAIVRREGQRLSLSSTTGVVRWSTEDETDLDYTALPLARRLNAEKATQFTQEVRLASAANAPLVLANRVALRWQSGLFFFTQGYEQQAVNTFGPSVLSPLLPMAVALHSPESQLDDAGVGAYGQATATIGRLDLTAGARVDYERKEGTLNTFTSPAISAPRSISLEQGFSNVSPQMSVAFRPAADRQVYVTVSRGFKAGGFNPGSPTGSEAYGEEHTWNAETGLKSVIAAGRVTLNAALFFIDWEDLQLNLPDPAVPGQFYIGNAGDASSRGVEVELNGRVRQGVDLFGAIGYTRARFGAGSMSQGMSVEGKEPRNTPGYNATVGAQLSHGIRNALTVFGRAETVLYGAYFYDDLNLASQEAYALTNLRLGVRGRRLMVEGWVKNAFDTRYIPVAFEYPGFTASGFIGESGRPRTFGVSIGAAF